MIRDADRLATLRRDWEFARSRRAFIMRQAFISSGIGAMPSLPLMDFANNLGLVFAYSVLGEVLTQLRDEGLFSSKSGLLGKLMHASKGSLDWVNFALVDQGRCARNEIAHSGIVLPRKDCWSFVDAIEKEMLHWNIVDANDLTEPWE